MVLVMVSPVHNLSPFLMWQDLKEAIIIDADVCVWNVMITTIQQLGPNKKLKKIDWIVSSAGPGRARTPAMDFRFTCHSSIMIGEEMMKVFYTLSFEKVLPGDRIHL